MLEISDEEIDGSPLDDREHLLQMVQEAVGKLSLFLAFCFHISFSTCMRIFIGVIYKQMPMKYKAVSACKDIYIWTVFIYIVIWNYIWQKHIPFPSIYLKVASRHSLRSDPDAFEALTASHLKPARDEVERTLVIAKSKDVIALMFFSYSVYGNQTQVIYRVYISLGHTLRFCVFRSRENSLNIHWPCLKMTIYTQSIIRYVQGQWYIYFWII